MGPVGPNNPAGPQGQERRQHPRTKVAVEIELHVEGYASPIRLKTTDLSLGGCYLEMMFTLEKGTKLNMVLWIDGAQMNTGGIVVTRDLQVGNGIKFTNMAPEERLKLKRFLDAHPPS